MGATTAPRARPWTEMRHAAADAAIHAIRRRHPAPAITLEELTRRSFPGGLFRPSTCRLALTNDGQTMPAALLSPLTWLALKRCPGYGRIARLAEGIRSCPACRNPMVRL